MHNLLLTGIPRSGLTVVSALLDTLPASVSLNEPAWQTRKAGEFSEPLPFCKWLVGDYIWQRQRLLAGETVRDFRAEDGSPLTDGMKDPRMVRNEQGQAGNVFFTVPGLEPHFTLTMKQHALYTAVLPELVGFEFFKIIAVIRHPFDVIHSWHTLQGHALAKGKLKVHENWWAEPARINTLDIEPLERMVRLYEAFCQRYYELRDVIHILKFEDVQENPAIVSMLLGETAPSPGMKLYEKRPRMLVEEQTRKITGLLKKNGTFTQHFYPL